MRGKIQLPRSTRYRFILAMVLDGTQDFRWKKLDREWYSGVLAGNIVHLRQCGDTLEYRGHTNLNALLTSYFRLHENIDSVFASLSRLDPHMASLIKCYPHFRLLRQPDPWECTVAYICSANNSIEGIAKIVEKISSAFGNAMKLEDDVRYSFPTPESILKAGYERLQALRLGLPKRPIYIVEAARRVCDRELDFQNLSRPEMLCSEVVSQLRGRRGNGIGPKISACIALFSLDKPQAFPIDTHIRNAIRKAYPVRAVIEAYPTKSTKPNEWRDKKLAIWAQMYFGENSGWASQLLFQSRPNKTVPSAVTTP